MELAQLHSERGPTSGTVSYTSINTNPNDEKEEKHHYRPLKWPQAPTTLREGTSSTCKLIAKDCALLVLPLLFIGEHRTTGARALELTTL
jgi:hypothetical protein